MRLEAIKVKRFRGYKEEQRVSFDNLTLIVGKNDIGKSTILEAADIFFGNRKLDASDLNVGCDKDVDKVEIAIEFSGFPATIDIDAGATTSLAEEFLLNANGRLEVRKIYSSGGTPKVFLHVSMPAECDVLIGMKITELRTKANALEIPAANYNGAVSNSIRKAIWAAQDTTTLEEKLIDISKEDGKKIYEKLEASFPIYTLFSADRKNTDQDDEVQAPIKASIKEFIATLSAELDPIRDKVLERLDTIAKGTIEKLSEMNPEVAQTLKSIAEKPAWEKAFSINIESDGIPLNKRGSGVKRLVLINFFRQEAERKRGEDTKTDVFYAIEEPETSQHPDWQAKLMDAFHELVEDDGVQIAMTSHHPELCGFVSLSNIRLIKREDGNVTIKEGDENNYKEISNTLGVLPKLEGVKVIVGVEGPNDVEFFRNIAGVFGLDGNRTEILWIPMGGGTLVDYVDKGYLEVLNLPQVYFFDRDPDAKYSGSVGDLKAKDHWAELSKLLTVENYIHPRLYTEVWPTLAGAFVDTSTDGWLADWSEKNVPSELCTFIKAEFAEGNTTLLHYGQAKIKKQFSEVAAKMTEADFREMGTFDEMKAFFDQIRGYLP
jgi:putative ATP-dependent endonuclease of OLD family